MGLGTGSTWITTFKDNNNNGIPDDEEDLDDVTEDTDSLSVDEADTSDNNIIS